jgi:FkbM family methyltransferase
LIDQLLSLPEGAIQIADVGASHLGAAPPYQPLLDRRLARLFAFEPDDREIDNLRLKLGQHGQAMPYAIGDGGTHTLHLCAKGSGMSSLLEPDPSALGFFNMFPDFGRVEATLAVTTRRLDDIEELPALDFLKMDVQGSELMVLANGRQKLKDCVVVQSEVSFVTLYKNQPTFADIDFELRSQGFMPHCFTDVKRWSISPIIRNNNARIAFNQLLEADVVYVRDVIHPEKMTDRQMRTLAVIAHLVYGSPDLAGRCLIELQNRKACGEDSLTRYLAAQ